MKKPLDKSYYWELDKPPEWHVLIRELEGAFEVFTRRSLKLSEIRNQGKTQYINEVSLCRYRILCKELLNSLREYDACLTMLPMKQWILLGAVTEVSLQIILAVYENDYVNERWQQWDYINSNSVKQVLYDALQKLVDEGEMTGEQKRSIYKALTEKIKEHTTEHPIDRIMLDELRQFAQTTDLLLEDRLLKTIEIIQRNRNCIHAFSDRQIDGWDVLFNSVNALGYMLDDFGGRFDAEISDE